MIDYERIRRSVDREAELRTRGRALELDPDRRVEADDLFRQASDIRLERTDYLRQCGLI